MVLFFLEILQLVVLELLLEYCNKLTPIPIGILMGIIDGIIVIIGFIAFDPDSVMYSILALMTITYIVNCMMSGAHSSAKCNDYIEIS